ncbi:MAG: hypothetical protein ACT4QE_12440 [Anaerolineales bacterium]
MTLEEVIEDIHALDEDLRTYERKYGVLSETFYESYARGEEPADEAWVQDWTDWAGAYQIWLRRRDAYRKAIESLRADNKPLATLIAKTARHVSLPVSA